VSAIGAQSAPIVPRLPSLRISLARNTAHGGAAYLLLFHAGLHEAEGQEGGEKAKRMRALYPDRAQEFPLCAWGRE